ncbi:MAG: hypothetical protein KY475_15975 [Planctomycetes bacterium]|nr:hypothetical protein [Planctomycetota bacterium]
MNAPEQVPLDEIILKRISKIQPNCILAMPDGSERATSFAIKNREHLNEEGSSCSRLLTTSPQQLLALVRNQGLEPGDFTVCRIRVADVVTLGWQVVACPTDEDPGHCEIRATADQPFRDKLWSRLARKCRILTFEEIDALTPGDTLPT